MDRRTAMRRLGVAGLSGTWAFPRSARGRARGGRIDDAEGGTSPRALSRRVRGERKWLGVTLSPDGALVAACGDEYSGALRRDFSPWLWDAAGGDELRAFPWPGDAAALAVAFDPAGARLAAGGVARLKEIDRGISVAGVWDGGAARAWDVATGRELYSLPEQDRSVVEVGFGTEYIATLANDSIYRLYRADDGRATLELAGLGGREVWGGLLIDQYASFSTDATRAVAISRAEDARRNARSDESILKLWDASAEQAGTLRVRRAGSVALIPDGSRFATASHGRPLILYDFETRGVIREFEGETGRGPWILAFSPDGRLVAAGDRGGLVRVWYTGTGRLARTIRGPETRVRAVAFLPDDRLRVVSGGYDGTDERDPEIGVLIHEPLMVWEAGLGLDP